LNDFSTRSTIVAGKLPDRSWTGFDRSSGYNQYSCNFGFQQLYSNPLGVDTLFDTNNDGNEYILVSNNDLNNFIVNTVSNPPPSKQVLENAASQTTTSGITENKIFQNFPSFNGDGIAKGPLKIWED